MGEVNPLLEVRTFGIGIEANGVERELVSNINLSVNAGEMVVLLGESGSGKTLLSRGLTGLFPQGPKFTIRGEIVLSGKKIPLGDENELLKIRRRSVRYIFQDAMQALNPVRRIGAQMRLAADTVATDDRLLIQALHEVGLGDAERILASYPHQLSGGMAQRVMIAMALLPSPDLLIADEPTSSVDIEQRWELLELIVSRRAANAMAVLLITHDISIASAYGDRVIVLYGGRVVESAPRPMFFKKQFHPYAELLVHAGAPRARDATAGKMLSHSIGFSGCRFTQGCPKVQEMCAHHEPPLEYATPEREVRCYYWK